MPQPPSNLRLFQSLVEIIAALRGPEGCPWDKEQTHASLTRFAIEEAHELASAIDAGDPALMREELGDVLLQVVLHAEIARQSGEFAIEDVIETLAQKMIHRHPHVFGAGQAESSGAVMANWQEIKSREKADRPKPVGPRDLGIPDALPALIVSHKIGEKAKVEAFDWPNISAVMDKVREEIGEVESALAKNDHAEAAAEIGDLLFSLAQVARHLGIDAEATLRQTNTRFSGRYQIMRQLAESAGKDWFKLSDAEKESFWQQAKVLKKNLMEAKS